METKIILVGKGASGKDHLSIGLTFFKLRKGVFTTTRKRRPNEIHSYDYHFVTGDQFETLILDEKLFKYEIYDDDYYGITKEEWEKSDYLIMTPSMIKELPKQCRENCKVVYLDIDEQTRRTRLERRAGSESAAERRLINDEKDFKGFIDFDYFIKDQNFDTAEWSRILIKDL